MKKVLSFVLVLSMILGSFGMAFAAAPSDVVGKDYEDAVNVLMELGVVEGYKDGTYRPEKVVTRAEMATLIIKALGLNDYAVGKSNFSDMAGHWADAYVAYAASLGFISGYGDGTFRPNQTVTYDQAITMVVQALGYKAEYMVGGYPGAFVAQAKTLGMLDGIKSGAAGANRGDVATLLFNTLPARFVRYDKDGALQGVALSGTGDNTVYDTMLRRLGASAYNTGKAFVVDGEEPSVINLKEYQGAYVTAYQNDDKKIIAIEEVKSVFLTGNFESNVGSVAALDANGTVEFTADDVTYTIKKDAVSDEFNTFKNGKEASVTSFNTSDDYTIAVELSGKKITDLYSVSVWTGATTKQATAAMVKNIAKNDYITASEKFPVDDNDAVDYEEFILNGAEKVTDIKEDDVLTIYTSGNTITKLEVGTKVVTGKVSKVTSDAKKITVAGETYKMYNDSTFTVDAGDEVELTLTYGGKVFKAEEVSGKADKYAIVMKVQVSDDAHSIDSTDAKIKLFLADGTEKVYLIDEDEVKDFNTTNIAGKYAVGNVVKYDTNKDGEINALEAVKASADKVSEVTLSKRGTFGTDKVADDAVIFVTTTVGAVRADEIITAQLDSDDDYAVTTKAKLLDKEIANAAYVIDEDTDEIVFMLIDGSTTSDAVYGVITDKYTVDTDAGYEIVVMIDGVEKKIECDSKTVYQAATPAKNLVEFKFDANNYIDGIKEVATDAGKIWVSDEIVIAANAENTIDFENGRVKYAAANLNKLLADDAIVYVWDADDEVWTVGDTSDFDGADDIKAKFYITDVEDKNEIDFVVIY